MWGPGHDHFAFTDLSCIPVASTSGFIHSRLVRMSWEKNSRRLQVPAKRYRIGELVRYSPFSRQTIHNYTIMGLIREAEWTEGGHRLYDESVFDRLSRIIELRESMSLNEIRRILNEEEKIQRGSRYDSTKRTRQFEPSSSSDSKTLGMPGEDFMSSEAT